MSRFLAIVGLSLLCLPGCIKKSSEGPVSQPVSAGMGIMVGEVTSGTAHVQVRLTTANELVDGDVPGVAGVVEFTLKAADGSGEEIPAQQVAAEESRDFIA
ncbi:MAG: hypothetical protein GY917_03375, partial [Planctomycetaceae bacterium]|nr:hypothetical protein [Planctomycetaceae bacterium]